MRLCLLLLRRISEVAPEAEGKRNANLVILEGDLNPYSLPLHGQS
jgi:hypothetical protein